MAEVANTSGKLAIEPNGNQALIRIDGVVVADGIDPYQAAKAFLEVGAKADHGPSKRLRALMQKA